MDLFICLVCGYAEVEDLPWMNEHTPSFTICDCCGVEFGYEDATQEGKLKYRQK